MANSKSPRSSAKYKAWRKQVLQHCEPICIRCGQPVDMTLPSSNPRGPSADHDPPLALTGDIAPSLDQSGIAHLDCNRSHGGRLGSARAQANRASPTGAMQPPRNQKGKNLRSNETDFFRAVKSTPADPASFTPQGPETAVAPPVEAELAGMRFVMPRIETGRPAAVLGSYGEQAREWLGRVYGLQLRGWQAYALDRALEYTDGGMLAWPTVLLTVGRQSGKSTLARAICLWRMHHAELFGETQTILHCANTTTTALEVMRPAGLWAEQTYGRGTTRWGNSGPQIELPSGDRWLVRAANESAGVGYSISMAFIDECWKIDRAVVDDAIAPTMAERKEGTAQMWLVSTAGDSTSDLMANYRQHAIQQLDDPQPGGILILEWSAPELADVSDRNAWPYGSPEWTQQRLKFLEQQFANIAPSAFARQYLNHWIARANHWMLDGWWERSIAPDIELPQTGKWIVALESEFDGTGHAVAIAGMLNDGRVVTRVSMHRTMKEAGDKVAEIRRSHPSIMVLASRPYIDRLAERIDAEIGSRQAPEATNILLDLFDRGKLLTDGSTILRESIYASTKGHRQSGSYIMTPQGSRGVCAIRALMFAVAEATKTARPLASIHVRRRA